MPRGPHAENNAMHANRHSAVRTRPASDSALQIFEKELTVEKSMTQSKHDFDLLSGDNHARPLPQS